MQRFWIYLGILMLGLFIVSSSFGGGINPIPPLNNILEEERSSFKEKNTSIYLEDMLFEIKNFYYQIQYQEQKLEILNEVKGHFEKAVGKAEEKYDEGEESISQSDITKLKLGLAGTLNDIYEVETDLQISRLSLSDILNNKYSPIANLADPVILPVEFEFDDFRNWQRHQNKLSLEAKKEFILRKAFLKVVEAKKKMQLAKKNRKMTRALLVSEVANYDFGIGNSGDLFQALIIYTRVLKGYYDSIYNFNLSVAKLDRDKK